MNTQARIGLIIPSGNRLTQPQFNQYAPPGMGIYITRLRMTGQWRKPPNELKKSLTEAAEALSDTKPDLIVFHCTANSMENGLAHEAALVETIQSASGCPTSTRSSTSPKPDLQCSTSWDSGLKATATAPSRRNNGSRLLRGILDPTPMA